MHARRKPRRGFVLPLLLASLGASGWACPGDGTNTDASTRGRQPATATLEGNLECRVAYNGPVAIVPVRTSYALYQAMSERAAVPIVYETDNTAIYEDGRVLTTRVEEVGDHLSALGWAENPMRILGAATGASARRASMAATGNPAGTSRTTSRRRG